MKIRWNPKVRKEKIWELYQKESKGIVDQELIDEVGIALLLRCKSILMVCNREVSCPECKKRFQLKKTWHDQAKEFRCPSMGCLWKIDWEEYHNSWKHRDLMGGNAAPAFREYLHAYPRAADAKAKMVLIDKLIHSFHMHAKSQLPTKTVSCNLIEGNAKKIVEMLDRLSFSDGISKVEWKSSVEIARQFRLGRRQ